MTTIQILLAFILAIIPIGIILAVGKLATLFFGQKPGRKMKKPD
jgi:hypothetical protein